MSTAVWTIAAIKPAAVAKPLLDPAIAAITAALGPDFVLWISIAAAAGFTALACYPVYLFIRRGWRIKRDDIFSAFSPDAKTLYLKSFFKDRYNEDITKAKTGKNAPAKAVVAGNAVATAVKADVADPPPDALFEKLYIERYGRINFAMPLLLFVVTSFAAMFFLTEAALTWVGLATAQGVRAIGIVPQALPIALIPQVAAAGIGGAYLWIVPDMISRAQRLRMTPADVLNASLRLAMAAALAVAVVQMAAPAIALPIAFAVGAFPLDTVRVMLRRFASDKLGLGVGVDTVSTDQILNLDGIDRPTCDRLIDADITTIAQLAYCDPVQLCMRTGLGFDYVVDIASQALAWIYLGDRLDDLRSAGLRGAMEIYWFIHDLAHPADQAWYALANALLKVAPTLPKDTTTPPVQRTMNTAQFLSACDGIANDPGTKFLIAIWHAGATADYITPDYATLLGVTVPPKPTPPVQQNPVPPAQQNPPPPVDPTG